MHEAEAREALAEVSRRLVAEGLNHLATGNASVRLEDGILITPTGIPGTDLRPEDGVVLLDDGSPRDHGALLPSSEWRLHLALYRRPHVGAVVHTHSPDATAAAIVGRAVPAVHYLVASFGGTVLPCAPYATYGTESLAESVAATLGDTYNACLMANHGAVAVGPTLRRATDRAIDAEWVCGEWRRALALGEPVILDDAELDRVRAKFATYGQQR